MKWFCHVLKAYALVLAVTALSARAEVIMATAKKASTPPKIDGKSDDAAWKAVTTTGVKMLGVGDIRDQSFNCNLKIVHDGRFVYVLVSWEDSTNDSTHKDFVWSADKKVYLESEKIEDQFSIAWRFKGIFTANMLTPVRRKTTWDVWQWGAARTNPVGYALDLLHIYDIKKPGPRVKNVSQHRTRDGRVLYMARPQDSGTPVFKKIRMSSKKRHKKTADVVKQFRPQRPTLSAADVTAKGVWAEGKWTLEFKRKLNTTRKDDVVLKPGSTASMALAVFDHMERNTHYASNVIKVKF